MDALGGLELPSGYFDLVNQRLGWSFLRTWDWPNLLNEYQRIAREGASSGSRRATRSPRVIARP